jgi:hypothetical protein
MTEHFEDVTPERPYATYNITTDKIQLYLDRRLDSEEYEKARAAKYTFWHGRKCFAAKWSTAAEDFALLYVSEILDDDTPDDLDSRVQRYKGYAERAEENASEAANRQTNTDRQARMAEGTFVKENEKAGHWNHRIAGAIRHAAMKTDPGVIVRRIKKLETSLKKHNTYIERLTDQLENGAVPAEKNDTANGLIKLYERWIEHNNMLVEYETAYLEAVGGDPRESIKNYKAGDIVRYSNGQQYKIRSIGSANVDVVDEHAPSPYNVWGSKIRLEDFGSPEVIGYEEPAKRKRREAPKDGIKKGVTVEWSTWQSRYEKADPYISTVISAGTKNIKVTIPDSKDFDYARSQKVIGYRIPRKDAKVINAE